MAPILLKAEPLTHQAWAPFGHVIQGTDDLSTVPNGINVNKITHLPQPGNKLNRLAPISESYATHPLNPHNNSNVNSSSDTSSATAASSSSSSSPGSPVTSISLVRIGPPENLKFGTKFNVVMMERHQASSQAFIPFGRQRSAWNGFNGVEGLSDEGKGGMLVLGALNGKDDKPDLSTLRAFLASPSQGVSYNEGIWHHSLLSFDQGDFAVIDTQITTNNGILIDCEIVRPEEGAEPFAVVQVPSIF